ncbi:RNA-directed DNA polymerase, eukaryota, reverse transcriptase zinc-binding domain protein [Tanacetum coccineum]
MQGNSYVSAVMREDAKKSADNPIKKLKLLDSDLIQEVNSTTILLAKAKNPVQIPYLNQMWNAKGFESLLVQFMGGLWVWIEFPNSESCINFQSNLAVRNTLKVIKPFSNSFYVKERAVWIEIIGLPLCAWTPEAFKKIASLFGPVLFFDHDAEEQKGCGKVCILSEQIDYIHDRVSISVMDNDYQVLVREILNWCPTILKVVKDSSPEESINSFESDKNKTASFKHNDIGDDLEMGEFVQDSFHEFVTEINRQFTENHTEDPITNENTDNFAKKDKLDGVFPTVDVDDIRSAGGENNIADSIEKPDVISDSSSKPPGFNGIRFQSPKSSNAEPSHSSFLAKNDVHHTTSLKNSQTSEGSFLNTFDKYIAFGNALGYDMKGVKSIHKQKWVKRICMENDVSVLGIQETKLTRLDFFAVKALWGNFQFNVACSSARGISGGILTIWDPATFHSTKISSLENVLIVEGIWTTSEFIIFGDFNAVRHAHERQEVVRQSWSEMECSNRIRIGDRQKLLKNHEDIDKELDNGIDPIHLAPMRMIILNDLFSIDTLENMNLAQKKQKTMVDYLSSHFSETEIKDVIWSCGNEKSPGPNGFSFYFIKHFWELFKVDVFAFVHEFFNTSHILRGCNSYFITLIPKKDNPMNVKDYRPLSLIRIQYKVLAKILANRLASVIDSVISNEQSTFIKGRQILDGPLMINEIVEWCKRPKKKAKLFKIDFEKAFDTISWDYIFSMLYYLGFGSKWIQWIKACLSSSFASVLINGSPTTKFKIGHGLRQGDPLSPFLFIIGMEGLHVAIQDAIDSNLFTGLYVGNNNCFGIANKHSKIKLYRIGIHPDELTRMARITGCNSSTLPFTYLGLPVGLNMHHSANWSPIIGKVQKHLSTWKANLLSIGGRLTLIKLGGNGEDKKIHWTKWNLILNSKEKGGLGVTSLHALNLALIYKWRWRNGLNIKFWIDNWLEGITLQYRFPHLYALKTFKNCTCAERYLNGVWNCQWRRNRRNGIESYQLSALMDALANVSFNNGADTWIWNVDNSHVFSVSNARYLIDNANLTPGNRPTKWSKYVPLKINIFAWRLLLNRLPMKINLSDRDIDVPNILFLALDGRISTEWEVKNRYRSHYSVDIVDHLKILKSVIFQDQHGDDVASIKLRCQDFHGDSVRDSAMASGRGRFKVDLESSMWRRRQDS